MRCLINIPIDIMKSLNAEPIQCFILYSVYFVYISSADKTAHETCYCIAINKQINIHLNGKQHCKCHVSTA